MEFEHRDNRLVLTDDEVYLLQHVLSEYLIRTNGLGVRFWDERNLAGALKRCLART